MGLPVALTQTEVNAFMQDVPSAAADLASMQLGDSGDPTLDWATSGAIPRNGKAYAWGSRYVLVSIDAKYIWHFIDITNVPSVQSLVASTNAPPFFSPPGNVFSDIWNSVGSAASTVAELPQNIIASAQAAVQNTVAGIKKEVDAFGAGVNEDFQSGLDNLTKAFQTTEYIVLAVVVVLVLLVGLAVWKVKSFDIPGLSVRG